MTTPTVKAYRYRSTSAGVNGMSTDAAGVSLLRGAYGTLERDVVIGGLAGGSLGEALFGESRTFGLGGSDGGDDAVGAGTGGGGICAYAWGRTSGRLEVLGEPDVLGREFEPEGDAGTGPPMFGGITAKTGDRVCGEGDEGSSWWFPGSASGELVYVAAPSRSLRGSDAPDDRLRGALAERGRSLKRSASDADELAVDGRDPLDWPPPGRARPGDEGGWVVPGKAMLEGTRPASRGILFGATDARPESRVFEKARGEERAGGK